MIYRTCRLRAPCARRPHRWTRFVLGDGWCAPASVPLLSQWWRRALTDQGPLWPAPSVRSDGVGLRAAG